MAASLARFGSSGSRPANSSPTRSCPFVSGQPRQEHIVSSERLSHRIRVYASRLYTSGESGPHTGAPCTASTGGLLERCPESCFRHKTSRKHVRSRASGSSGAPEFPDLNNGSHDGRLPAHNDKIDTNGSRGGIPLDKADLRTGYGSPPLSPASNPASSTAMSWTEMVMSLPLELAAASAKMDAHWLQKRKRKHWWKREQFPRVPMDQVSEVPGKFHPPASLVQKLLPLALIFFCASFNLTILANLKDAIVVTSAGAEALPFLASFCVLPASFAFFFAYGRLVEVLPQRAVFYASVVPLVSFYVFFASILYPASGFLHPQGFYNRMAPAIPLGLHGLLKVIEYWTFSLFFCFAELWGSVVISVLFWSLANDVCSVADAKVIYPIMGIAANLALVVAGNYMKWVNAAFTQGSVLLSLRYLVSTVVVMSGVMLASKLYMDKTIKSNEIPDKAPKKKSSKKKGSMSDSLAVLRSSPKILNLALLVVGYGVSHRLFEFAWKGQLRSIYPSAQAYQGMLADVSIATGWATIGLMLAGRFVFQYLGWTVAATATPVVMLLAGGAFFGTSIMARLGTGSAAALATAGATAGAVTQVFARSSKFSLFDPAKEMVYIEMSKEEKSKGKAAVDLLGSQIGKSGASWITQALLLVTGSIQAALPFISAIFLMVIAAWIRAVAILGSTIKREEAEAASAAALKSVRIATETAALTTAASDTREYLRKAAAPTHAADFGTKSSLNHRFNGNSQSTNGTDEAVQQPAQNIARA